MLSFNSRKSNGFFHHDWFIEVVPSGSRFSFHCHHPKLEGYQQDGATYPTTEAAVKAGCYFIDRELALAALLDALEELISDQKISPEEYWNLSNFC